MKKTVGEIMAREVVTLKQSDSLKFGKDIMTQKRIRHFPVVEGGKVVGVVSQRDLFQASLASVLKYNEKTEKAFLENLSIKGVINESPITTSPDTSITEAARLMVEKKIGCLPVVDNEKLVGLVTETDFLKVVADG